VHMLNWLCAAGGCRWAPEAALTASECGQLHLLQWMADPGPEGGAPHAVSGSDLSSFMPRVCVAAAGGGHLAVLRWALPEVNLRDRPSSAWLLELFIIAARRDFIHVLTWLSDQTQFCELVSKDHAAVFQLAEVAASTYTVAIQEWLRVQLLQRQLIPAKVGERVRVPTHNMCEFAVRNGALDLLSYALERRWLPGEIMPGVKLCYMAASAGRLDVLRWARRQLLPDTTQTASNGQRHLFPWDETVCRVAAGCGHLAALQWLRSEGCPWDKHVARAAAADGHLEVLQWALAQADWQVRSPPLIFFGMYSHFGASIDFSSLFGVYSHFASL
jgi:hypothetical protein